MLRSSLTALALALRFANPARATPAVGSPAPDFTATGSNGEQVKLAGLRGKIVVLEWTNYGCPYCAKWYGSGQMQALQRHATSKGVVWLSVISSAPGNEGYVDGAGANQDTASRNAAPTHVLLDPTGTLGHLYDAVTTPEIYIIKPDGTLAYSGGIDSIDSADPADIPSAEPYAREALDEVLAGSPVKNPVTEPYGCSVKY